MDEKARIRKDTLRKRDALDPAVRHVKDGRIKQRLFHLQEFQSARSIFYYSSFRSEVSTLAQITETLKSGKRVMLPRVDTEAKQLRLLEITGTAEIAPGYWGIPEPSVIEGRERDINTVDLVVLPGAAFDTEGTRLGYGGGYYDKILAKLRKRAPLIALAYEEQIINWIPSEPHDIRVHKIVTDERVIECLKK